MEDPANQIENEFNDQLCAAMNLQEDNDISYAVPHNEECSAGVMVSSKRDEMKQIVKASGPIGLIETLLKFL